MTEMFGEEIQTLVVSVPVGVIMDYGGETAPTDWKVCNGEALQKSLYPELYAVLSTRYGDGDGSGAEFNLPDYTGRTSIGVAPSHAIAETGGVETVALTAPQMPSHDHGGQVAAGGGHSHSASSAAAGNHSHGGGTGNAGNHQHAMILPLVGGAAGGGAGIRYQTSLQYMGDPYAYTNYPGDHSHAIGADGNHSHGVTVDAAAAHQHSISAAGGGEAHTNMQPYLAINKIIKVQ